MKIIYNKTQPSTDCKVKDWEIIKADMGLCDHEKDSYSKDEVNTMMSQMYFAMRDMMYNVYEAAMSRDQGIVDGVNEFIEEHEEGHLPSMEGNQSKAILDAAGILDQFEDVKPPIQHLPHRIYAAFKDLDFKLKDNGQA